MQSRLELRCSMWRVVPLCIILGLGGGFLSWMGINNINDPEAWIVLLTAGLCWLCFVLAFSKLLDRSPQLIVDKYGITDRLRPWQVMTMSWEDIEEISFPRRRVGRYSRDYVVSIRFREPQRYSHQIPLMWKWTWKLTPGAGDYEISPYLLNGNGIDVFNHIWLQKQAGQISVDIVPPEDISPPRFYYGNPSGEMDGPYDSYEDYLNDRDTKGFRNND